jgi:hypothetical protein
LYPPFENSTTRIAIISVYKSHGKLGFVSLKVPHLSYDSEVQGMHADWKVPGSNPVEPPTAVEIIQCQVIINSIE